jgi:mercuric ion transport protein
MACCWIALTAVQSMPLCSGLQSSAKPKKEGEMEDVWTRRMFRTGLIGSVIVAICCFTPILVVLLGAIGLGAITGYLDYVLLPALAGFLGLTAYAVYRRKPATTGTCCASHEPNK